MKPEKHSPETDRITQLNDLSVRLSEAELRNEHLKTANAELEQSLSDLTDVFDHMPAGLFLLDRRGVIIDVNVTGSEMLGEPKQRLIQKFFIHYLSPESKNAVYHHLNRLKVNSRDQSVYHTFNIFVSRADRIQIPAVMRIKAVFDEAPDRNRLIVSLTDIQSLKSSELFNLNQLTHESVIPVLKDMVNAPFAHIDRVMTDTLKFIAEMIGGDQSLIVLFSDQGSVRQTYEWCRDSAASVSRQIRNGSLADVSWAVDMFSQSIMLYFPDISQIPSEKHRQILQELGIRSVFLSSLFEKEYQSGLLAIVSYRGRIRLSEHELKLLRILTITMGDVLRRHSVEIALRESEQTVKSVLNAIGYPVFLTNSDMTVQWINRAAFDQFGDQLLGSPCYKTLQCENKKGASVLCDAAKTISDGKIRDRDIRLITRHGKKRNFRCTIATVQINYRIMGILILSDVTTKIKTLTLLKKAYKNLKSAHAQLVQSAKLASIGELASGVCHELNQPLTVIRSSAQIIIENLGSTMPNSDQFRRLTEMIEQSTTRMTDIISHLMIFSRQAPSALHEVSVNHAIENSFMLIREQLKLQNIRVILNPDAAVPPVMGNSNRLEQVFLNLIVNSRDAIEKKKKDNPGFTDEDVIQITTRFETNDTHYIEILISDNGCGVDKQIADKIFMPFYTTKAPGEGTGLGLSIVYGIIRDHKGHIELAETGADGTTFRITLPVGKDNKNGAAA